MSFKPKVGISACLLGQRVRYNGEHKRNDWIVDQLNDFVTWVPVCPEMEMGLGAPRDPLRLVGKAADPKLIVIKTGEDLTERAQTTARRIVDRFEKRPLELDAFILKKASPSCGLEKVKVYGRPNTSPAVNGRGFFAAELTARFPSLPVIEEGRLSDPAQREDFIILLFAWARFRRLEGKVSALQEFHQAYKLLLMAHHPERTTRLGRIAANPAKATFAKLHAQYGELLLETLREPASVRRRVNALQHVAGYFKKVIASEEKQQVQETIDDYRRGELPLAGPLTLLHHLARRHHVTYLEEQTIFRPYPKGLKLG